MEIKQLKKVIVALSVFGFIVLFALLGLSVFFSRGKLQISSDYNDFEVLIDDKGFETTQTIELRPGKHQLIARKEDYKEVRLDFEIKNNKTTTVLINFETDSDDSSIEELKFDDSYVRDDD